MRGKWERKENGEGKGGKGEHFPLLDRRENGRGKKMGKENSVGPSPIFPQLFPPKMGDYKREKICTTLSNNHVPPHPPIFLPFYFPPSIQA